MRKQILFEFYFSHLILTRKINADLEPATATNLILAAPELILTAPKLNLAALEH